MVTDSEVSNAVPQMKSYATSATGQQYTVEPGQSDSENGVAPLDLLPAQWWNYFISKFTNLENNMRLFFANLSTEMDNLAKAMDAQSSVTGVATNNDLATAFGKFKEAFTLSADMITGTLSQDVLPIVNVAHGGTGRDTLTSNAVLTGNGTGNVNMVTTAAGALYADATNGVPKFGTLPVSRGGTGNTTADTTPTLNSTRMCTSGGIYAALAGKQATMTASTTTTDVAFDTSSAGTATTYSKGDHKHKIATASAVDIGGASAVDSTNGITVGSSGAGTNASAARSNHTHAVVLPYYKGCTSSAAGTGGVVKPAAAGAGDKYYAGDGTWKDLPAQTTIEYSTSATTADAGTSSAGTANTVSRGDHKHSISTAAAVTIGGSDGRTFGSNAVGTSTSLARADHTHAVKIPLASTSGAGLCPALPAAVSSEGKFLSETGEWANPTSSSAQYETCTTAAATAAKTTTSGTTAGLMVVTFSNTNTAAAPTLNGCAVKAFGTALASGNAGLLSGTCVFVLDGTSAHLISSGSGNMWFNSILLGA